MTTLLGERLRRRARAHGGAPLLTHYRTDRGERTELSAASLANWVDKTANLLDDLGLDPDAEVALPVLVEHPLHWMALLWPWACWQRGIGVRVLTRADATGADLVVTGPDAPTPLGGDTLACSLHPWGLPLPSLPDGVDDFASAALAQPDAHASLPADPEATAWAGAGGVWTFADVAALPPLAARLLLTDADPWTAVSTMVRVVTGGGSLVVVEGDGADRIAADEHAGRG